LSWALLGTIIAVITLPNYNKRIAAAVLEIIILTVSITFLVGIVARRSYELSDRVIPLMTFFATLTLVVATLYEVVKMLLLKWEGSSGKKQE
ncbi:MAG: hypothetical protein AB1489_42425, partial [Acidobacteriota bacterium]